MNGIVKICNGTYNILIESIDLNLTEKVDDKSGCKTTDLNIKIPDLIDFGPNQSDIVQEQASSISVPPDTFQNKVLYLFTLCCSSAYGVVH